MTSFPPLLGARSFKIIVRMLSEGTLEDWRVWSMDNVNEKMALLAKLINVSGSDHKRFAAVRQVLAINDSELDRLLVCLLNACVLCNPLMGCVS